MSRPTRSPAVVFRTPLAPREGGDVQCFKPFLFFGSKGDSLPLPFIPRRAEKKEEEAVPDEAEEEANEPRKSAPQSLGA